MKMTCDRSELLEALTGVSKAVSAKSSIPAIEGILFKCTNYTATLTAYDLEIGITTSVTAQIENPTDIVINGKLLIDMIRKIEADSVTIETTEELKITIKGGLTQFTIMGIPASDFPELPVPEAEDTMLIPGAVLREMIGKTIYAVSTSDQKPVHTGTKFILQNNELTMVSVDGFRLAECKKSDVTIKSETSFVVPAKTLVEISRLIGDGEEEVSIGTARRYGVFKLSNYTVVTRLLEGDFLDYTKSIPQGYRTRVKINVHSLYDAVERASLIISDRFKSPVCMVFEDHFVQISCVTALGNASDELSCETEGEVVEIGFNNRYIMDALRNSGEEEVYMELSGPLSPIKIVPVDGDEFLFLVLPIRIKNAQ